MPSVQPDARDADAIDPGAIRRLADLATVEHLAKIGSTMDRGRELAGAAADRLPALVVADRQTAGRGRQGSGWWQAEGSLAMSLVIDPVAMGLPAAESCWSLACGIAVAESLERLEPSIAPRLRWPNDIEVDRRKLAGILTERMPGGRVVFGLGLNTASRSALAPPPLQSRVVTVPDLVGHALPRQRLLEQFPPRLFAILTEIATDPPVLVDRYQPRCGLTGTRVRVYQGRRVIEGECLGIDAAGSLVVATASGRVACHSGSLTHPSEKWPAEPPR